MRYWLFATVAGLLVATAMSADSAGKPVCNLSAPDAAHAGTGCARAWINANIRINQLQVVGTAESYKQAPSEAMLSLIGLGGKKDAEALDFGEPPLAAQLDAGARVLSFDVANDPKGGLFKNPAGASMADDLLDPGYVSAMSEPGFKVIHVLDVDFRSSCLTVRECLTAVANWSRAHKTHVPIVIVLRTNDAKTPMPGATRPVPFDAAAFDALDAELRDIFKSSEVITPDQIMGGHASLREAVTASVSDSKLPGGWPKLGESRGKVIFVLDDTPEKTDLYAGPAKSLDGRVMFVTKDENSPLAGFISIEDPVKEAARISADVKLGFMVITRADDMTIEARAGDTARRDWAFASGAQVIATDFILPDKKIGPYQVTITDTRHAQCNPVLASDHCANWYAGAAVATTAAAEH